MSGEMLHVEQPHRFPALRPGQYAYKLGCRCSDCLTLRTITNGVRSRAATLLRELHPDLWERLVDEAYEAAGLPRCPPGRPKA